LMFSLLILINRESETVCTHLCP